LALRRVSKLPMRARLAGMSVVASQRLLTKASKSLQGVGSGAGSGTFGLDAAKVLGQAAVGWASWAQLKGVAKLSAQADRVMLAIALDFRRMVV
jgi:hypothetical protein